MIIPFRRWHQEYPIKNIADPDQWCFDDTDCQTHLLPEDERISVEWDEDVLNDPNAVVMAGLKGLTKKKLLSSIACQISTTIT